MKIKSKIDTLFEEIFGFLPDKAGESYELLASAVVKLLREQDKVFHDQKLRGELSETLHQIDVLHTESSQRKVFGEAKDYTYQEEKVGRPDLQKLVGALADLQDLEEGAFFSATGFTKPAIKYADVADKMIGKPIKLYDLRPSVAQDEEGRIKRIEVTIRLKALDFEGGKYDIICTEQGFQVLEGLLKQQLIRTEGFELEDIFDAQGAFLTSISDLSYTLSTVSKDRDMDFLDCCFWTPNGFIKINEYLIGIHGISNSIPISRTEEKIVIETEGEFKILFKSLDGKINKLITDADLRKISFLPNGEVET